MPFTPEFRLATACCIWPSSDRRTAAIERASSSAIDWNRFLRLVKHHRVAALVANSMRETNTVLPAPVKDELGAAAKRILNADLLKVGESHRIQTSFEADGLRVAFVKGPSLGMLAYGRIGLKSSWDIDVLIAPQDLARATAVLGTLGYDAIPPLPEKDSRAYAHWLQYGQEYIFFHRGLKSNVEVHWRLASNRTVLCDVWPSAHTQMVAISGDVQLRTLAQEHLVPYLCMHCARHGCSSLRWIADIAALIGKSDEAGLQRLLARARQSNTDIVVGHAIVLCHDLFELPQTAAIAQSLKAQCRQRQLKNIAFHYLTTNGTPEPRRSVFVQLRLLLARFLLAHGLAYVMEELTAQLFAPGEVYFHERTALGSAVFPVLRVLRWIKRSGGHRTMAVMERSRRAKN